MGWAYSDLKLSPSFTSRTANRPKTAGEATAEAGTEAVVLITAAAAVTDAVTESEAEAVVFMTRFERLTLLLWW